MADIKKPWCDGPYQLITRSKTGATAGTKQTGSEAVATEMVIMHNTLIRSINAVHRQAVNVASKGTAKDKLDFVNFAYQWTISVASHHKLEEEKIFPRVAEETGVKNIMETNLEEHHAFEAGLETYQAHLTEIREGRAELDGWKLRELIDDVMPTLHTHLNNEIDTLLSLKPYDDKCDIEKIFRDEVGAALNYAMKDYNYRNNLLPVVFICHDKKFEDGVWMEFPPVPLLPWLAIRWIFYRTNIDWWRFAPCDIHSMPQELPFA